MSCFLQATEDDMPRIASDFLIPENFRTGWDGQVGDPRREEQYRKGLAMSEQAHTISISYSDSWSATMKDGGSQTAYERIGYHACTADLLRGFLDGPAQIVVYRQDQIPTIIKPARAQYDGHSRHACEEHAKCSQHSQQ
jgi:hypothetical protein